MKIIAALVLAFSVSTALAQEKVKMYFKNEDIVKIIEIYSKVSGQKFVVDSSVRGTASIFLQEPVTVEEAFNHLSSVLALNGFAISKQGDTMVIRSSGHNSIVIYVNKHRESISSIPDRHDTIGVTNAPSVCGECV